MAKRIITLAELSAFAVMIKQEVEHCQWQISLGIGSVKGKAGEIRYRTTHTCLLTSYTGKAYFDNLVSVWQTTFCSYYRCRDGNGTCLPEAHGLSVVTGVSNQVENL